MQLVCCQFEEPIRYSVESDGPKKVGQFTLNIQYLAERPGPGDSGLCNGVPLACITLEGPGNIIVRDRVHVIKCIGQRDAV